MTTLQSHPVSQVPPATLAAVRMLVDADILGKDRRTEIYVLQNTTAAEASNTAPARNRRTSRGSLSRRSTQRSNP